MPSGKTRIADFPGGAWGNFPPALPQSETVYEPRIVSFSRPT